MTDARLTRQFPEGQGVDPTLAQHRLRPVEQHGTEIAMVERPSGHDLIVLNLDID
ncbi:hypothetical protein Msi02_54470 [Microbispora siamensis]|uniref:Uncharacterized protein n=1 Tax=Microbispora siamensis TaxID=564413 RepID=A0ABQ4GTD3_9ACTN|nr:hypothetical protein Msi02_54470 [Microbispora siamensis]